MYRIDNKTCKLKYDILVVMYSKLKYSNCI